MRPCISYSGFAPKDKIRIDPDFDRLFAQFVKVPIGEVLKVDCHWKDVELGANPSTYGTSGKMGHRGRMTQGEHVVVAGISGGAPSAVLELQKRRGATVIAIAATEKNEQLHLHWS